MQTINRKASADGTFSVNGRTWGTIRAIGNRFGVPTKTVQMAAARLSDKHKRAGRGVGGQRQRFYVVSELARALRQG